MALEIFVDRIDQKESEAKRGEKYQLYENTIADSAGNPCGSAMSPEDFQVIKACQTPEPGIPGMKRLDRGSRFLGGIAHDYLATTHSKVIFISSLVTILPAGSLGEGGLIPKSVIFKFALPRTTN